MKTNRNAIRMAAILGIAAIICAVTLLPHQAQAAELSGGEHYKVIDCHDISEAQELGAQWNTLGADGWKVRTWTMLRSGSTVLILAKQVAAATPNEQR